MAELPDRLLRIAEVESMTGFKRRMIYKLLKAEKFPRQYKPGGWSSRWSEKEVIEWVAKQRR